MTFGRGESADRNAPWRTALFVLTGFVFIWCAGVALGDPARAVIFKMSNGQQVELPDLSDLNDDCRRVRETADRIDATRYRSGPRPKHPEDRPLFEYENALSKMIMRCGQTRSPVR